MPTSTDVTTLKINELTEAQYDAAVQGGVIGANELSILTDVDDAIQVDTMPVAAVGELGKVYQFIGTTDASYTHGYFYECVSDGQQPATYSWSNVEVQPSQSGGLPSQTGNAGKFLTTDGTDASWSDKPLVNTATGTDSFTILGTPTSVNNSANIGIGSAATDVFGTAIGISASTVRGGVAIGWGAQIKRTDGVAIGGGAQTNGEACVAIGYNAKATGAFSLSFGNRAESTAAHAIQIGCGNNGVERTNSVANTVKIANANGNFEVMSADGTIPTDRLTKVNTTITLAAADWSSNTQTVSVTGMTTTGVVMVSPDPTDQSAYTSAGILCTAQAAGTLTFSCDTVPSGDIDVNVVML